MADIVLGCDSNGVNDAECQQTVATALEQAGHKVENLGIAPGPFADYSYGKNGTKPEGKIGVYLMAASLVSFLDAAEAKFDLNIFGIRGDVSEWGTENGFKTKGVPKDHHGDCTMPECDQYQGKTYPELNEIYKGKCIAVPGETPEKLAENIIAAINGEGIIGGSSASTNSVGGSAVLIPDKTFYGLIKQIIGAIDGVFTIANNMAYLLSFKDMYKYRNLYEEHIPELTAKDIVVDGIQRNWTTENLYNAVEVTYADGIVKYQHDALVKIYGENVFYYEFPNDDEETAKSKAKALLSAHIRDYSLDLEIDCVYNPNITVGSWVKIPKTFTNISNTDKKGPIKKLYKAKEKKLRKGVRITNINEITQKIDETNKTIQQVTTKDGEKYDIEIEKKDYEIYFVQGYRFRWTPKHAPIMNLHLKYGPDTPEDPVNATIGTGTVQTGGTSSGTSGSAMYGDDCFGVEISQLYGDHRIPHDGSGGIEYATQNPPSDTMTSGRCKQGSKYEQEVAGKTAEEAFYIASSKFKYCCYADNCGKYKCNEERWTSGECGFNCGDCATILKSVLDCVGQKNWIFHIDGHYHTMIDDNGTIKSVDLSRGVMSGGDSNTHSAGWPVAGTGTCSCACYNC